MIPFDIQNVDSSGTNEEVIIFKNYKFSVFYYYYYNNNYYINEKNCIFYIKKILQ